MQYLSFPHFQVWNGGPGVSTTHLSVGAKHEFIQLNLYIRNITAVLLLPAQRTRVESHW